MNISHSALILTRFIPALLAAMPFSLQAMQATHGIKFDAPIYVPVSNSPQAMVVADFNLDGIADIALAVSAPQNKNLGVLIGKGDGTFKPITNIASMTSGSHGLVVGDFNGDGKPDINGIDTGNLSILAGDGIGNFTQLTNYVNNVAGQSFYLSGIVISTGHLDWDNKSDLVLYSSSRLITALSVGEGKFSNGTSYPAGAAIAFRNVAIGDCNGDGLSDLVTADSGSTNTISVFTNRGNGTFALLAHHTGNHSNYQTSELHNSISLADLNGDGKLDIVIPNYYAKSISIRFNDGHAGFTNRTDYAVSFPFGPFFYPNSVTTADFNNDGAIDLFVSGGTAARVLTGNGDGTFNVGPVMSNTPNDFPNPNNIKSVGVGDFNRDGAMDVALMTASNSVAILLNTTPPTLQLTPYPNHNQINWSAVLGNGYILEMTVNFQETNSWQPFPYPPIVIGDQKAVTDWSVGSRKFYRLRKP